MTHTTPAPVAHRGAQLAEAQAAQLHLRNLLEGMYLLMGGDPRAPLSFELLPHVEAALKRPIAQEALAEEKAQALESAAIGGFGRYTYSQAEIQETLFGIAESYRESVPAVTESYQACPQCCAHTPHTAGVCLACRPV